MGCLISHGSQSVHDYDNHGRCDVHFAGLVHRQLNKQLLEKEYYTTLLQIQKILEELVGRREGFGLSSRCLLAYVGLGQLVDNLESMAVKVEVGSTFHLRNDEMRW